MTIIIDIATDDRASELREKTKDLQSSMLELHTHRDMATKDTKYAKALPRMWQGLSSLEIDAQERAVVCATEAKAKLIQSIADGGFDDRWNQIECYMRPNGQVWVVSGMHRTSSLLALGLPVPAVLVDPTKEFKP